MLRKSLVLGLALLVTSPVLAATYEMDAVHSTIGFAVKHLVVGTTRGQFNTYSGTVEYDPKNLSGFKSDVTIDAASIDTKNADRDKHLKSADFFDVEKFPSITFKNAVLVKSKKNKVLSIVGDLTIKGTTKKVTIPVEISGPIVSPFGFDVVGITGEVMINRQDFGMTFSKALDNGGLMVSNDVKIIVELELHSKK